MCHGNLSKLRAHIHLATAFNLEGLMFSKFQMELTYKWKIAANFKILIWHDWKHLMNYKLRSFASEKIVMANPKLFVDFFPSNLTIALYITFSHWAWNSFSLPSSTNNQCVLELQHGKRELEPLTHESRIGKKHACFLFICRLWLLLPINATSRPDALSGKKE